MELNREQIIKALECCTFKPKCKECPYNGGDCFAATRDALSLIKELTEENERLRAENEIKSQKRANIFEIANAYERGQADTVRKLLDIMAENATNGYPRTVRLDVVERKAREMLEGNYGQGYCKLSKNELDKQIQELTLKLMDLRVHQHFDEEFAKMIKEEDGDASYDDAVRLGRCNSCPRDSIICKEEDKCYYHKEEK